MTEPMTESISPIAVLGAGAWGTAIAILLARNGNSVRLWDNAADRLKVMQDTRINPFSLPGIEFPESLTVVSTLEEAVQGTDDIFLVVPSPAFRIVLNNLKPLVSSTVRLAWGTKGLDPKSCEFLSDVVTQVFSNKIPRAVLSGPSFAKEVALNYPSAVSLAGNNPDFLKSLIKRFTNKNFHIYLDSDMIGVQLCGVVKNVMAIATGISDGMGFGANTRCALITRGLAEMAALCVALGGKAETTMSLAGVGDLVLTATDNQSRNRRFGLALGKGESIDAILKELGQAVEGYYNVKELCDLAKKHNVNMPISEQVYAILYEQRSPQSLLNALSN